MTLGITTLLSMTVFLMVIGESMPPTSEKLPLIGKILSGNNKPLVWCVKDCTMGSQSPWCLWPPVSQWSPSTSTTEVWEDGGNYGPRHDDLIILSFIRVPPCLRFMVFQVLAKILMMKINIAKKKRPRSPTESSSPLYSQKANCCLCQAQVPQLESNK